MGSIGCIFGELLQMQQMNCSDWKSRRVLFPGKTCFPFSTQDPFDYQHRTDQLRVVCDLIGTPSKEEIERFKDENVRIYLNNMTKSVQQNIFKLFPGTKREGVELMIDMLRFDVRKRPTANQLLKSEYFDDVRDENSEGKHVKIERFEFEDINIDENKLRSLILDEIMTFNPQWREQMLSLYKQRKSALKKMNSK